MSHFHESISTLIVKHIKRLATQAEKQQLEEWASLSVENRNWLERFYNYDWVSSRTRIYEEIDLEENKLELWEKIRQYKKQKTGKMARFRKASYSAAAAVAGIIMFIGIKQLTTKNKPVVETAQAQKDAVTTTQDNAKSNNTELIRHADQRANKKTIPSKKSLPEVITLPISIGQLNDYALPDGSKVWVNSGSKIEFPLTFSEPRRVEIKGEAYFEIRKKDKKPFQVLVNDVLIEATEGRFNVTAYKEEETIRITCMGGNVTAFKGPDSLYIKPGQSGYTAHQKKLQIKDNENLDKILAWKNGQFMFHNDSVGFVGRELARRYELTLEYDGKSKATVTFTGARSLPSDLLITKINATNPGIHMEIRARKLIIK